MRKKAEFGLAAERRRNITHNNNDDYEDPLGEDSTQNPLPALKIRSFLLIRIEFIVPYSVYNMSVPRDPEWEN